MRMKLTLMAVSTAILANPAAAFAQTRDFGSAGGFQVAGKASTRDEPGGCIALFEYDGPGSTKTTLFRTVKPDHESIVWLTVVNFEWSAKEGETYELSYVFDDGTYDRSAYGVKNDVIYKGFMAGLSYRFGGSDAAAFTETEDKNYDFEEDTAPSTVTIQPSAGKADPVDVPADTPVKAPENDYYFNSIHFKSDSAAIDDAQKVNLEAFIKKAKETGHTFKLVGRADATGSADYNKDLSARRIESVKQYAVDHGVDASKLVAMVKGAEDGSGAEGRRVDIFEHK